MHGCFILLMVLYCVFTFFGIDFDIDLDKNEQVWLLGSMVLSAILFAYYGLKETIRKSSNKK